MEYGLRVRDHPIEEGTYIVVLILVLMEYGLRDLESIYTEYGMVKS